MKNLSISFECNFFPLSISFEYEFFPIRKLQKSGTRIPSFHCLSESSNLSVGKGGSWSECPTYFFTNFLIKGLHLPRNQKPRNLPQRKSETGGRLEAPHLKPADEYDAVLSEIIAIIRRELILLHRVIKEMKKGSLWLLLPGTAL